MDFYINSTETVSLVGGRGPAGEPFIAVLAFAVPHGRGTHRRPGAGTHSGEFMGIPATGKEVKISGIDITRFENGQSAEHWGQWDVAGMMVQLGVAPPPPGAPETE